MASKNNFIPIIGTYNGINYYIRDGKQRQRKAGGGFTSESMKSNPNMQGIRNRNQELTLCSRFNKDFKVAMSPFFKDLNDGTLHERLMKLFMKIRILDEAVEGKRTAGRGLSCDMGRRLLNEFKFTKGPTTREILGPIASVNAKTGTLKVLGFDPKELKFPKGSTHFFLNYGVLEYDLKNNLFRFILSEEKVIFEKGADAHDLVFEVPENPKKSRLIFGVVKVQFCKKWADGFDISFAKGAVGIGVV